MTEQEYREAIVKEAETWLGTPYRHYSWVKGAGVDCAFLIIKVFSKVGLIEDFKPEYYPQDWAYHNAEEKYLSYILKYAKETKTPKPGDIALFKWGKVGSHAAILIDEENVIHSYAQQGVIKDSLKHTRILETRLLGYYSFFRN